MVLPFSDTNRRNKREEEGKKMKVCLLFLCFLGKAVSLTCYQCPKVINVMTLRTDKCPKQFSLFIQIFRRRQKLWTQPAAMVATAQNGATVESGVRSPGTTKMVNNQWFLLILINLNKIMEPIVQFLSPHSRVVGLCGTATERRVRDVSHWGEV